MQNRGIADAQARATERIAPLPDDPALAATMNAARTAALEAEDRFSQLEARFVSGLTAGLARAPDLSRAAVTPRRARLAEIIAAAGLDAEPPWSPSHRPR